MGRLYADMTDADLRQTWEESMDWEVIRLLEHEMAMRYMHKATVGSRHDYLTEKFLQMPARFVEACGRKEWYRAKYIYDSAIVIGLFLELPEPVRDQVFGSRQHEEVIDGMFPERLLERTMKECVIKNRLGFECVVYRIPGEVGFYGARREPGTSHMPAEANPAYHAK